MTLAKDYKKLDVYITINHTVRSQKLAMPNGHETRTAELVKRFARHLGHNAELRKELFYAANLHDAGKLPIDVEILEKRGELTPSEWLIVQSHPDNAYNVLQALGLTDNSIPLGILHHHVNYDGTGYPHVIIKEQDISLIGRHLAIVDRYDAMTNPRIYRARALDAFTPKRAITQLVKEAHKLDPELLAEFILMMDVK